MVAPGRLPGLPRLLWCGVAVLVLVAGAVLLGQTWHPAAEGLPDAGRLVVDSLPGLRLVMLLSGGIVLGFTLSAVGLDPTPAGGTRGLISASGRADLNVAVTAALVMAGAGVLLALVTLADVLGLPLSQTLQPGIVTTYVWEVEAARADLLCGLLALAVAVGLTLSRTLGGAACWLVVAACAVGGPSLTGHAAGLGSHSLALVAGFVHTAVAMLWSGGVVAIGTHALMRSPGLLERIRRFGVVAIGSVAALGLSGFGAAATRLDSVSELGTTTYGRMLLVKSGLLAVALVVAFSVRRGARGGRLPGRRVLVEIGVLGAALGVAVLLARTAFPRNAVELPSAGEDVIGYLYPPAPTFANVAWGWHPDWVWLTVSALAVGAYVVGVVVLRRRGDAWPVGRLVAWVLGWLIVVWATCFGVAWYAPVSFALHMLSHMGLAMFGPVLMVLGGPVTLALRAIRPATAGQRGPREWIIWALHSRLTRFLTHPLYVLFVYTIGLYGLYYTDLYASLMRSHLGHLAMQVHFLAAGYLFFWVVVGVDPGPRKLPYPARLLLLLGSLVIHTMFAVPMMMAESPMVADWYALVHPPWLTDPLADTRLAGGLAWGLGELPTLVVAVALGIQWARSDEIEARRGDRRADRDNDAELVAYNARLAALHEADLRSHGPRAGGSGEAGPGASRPSAERD